MKPLNELTIAMASDHAGFGLKSMIQLYLEREGAKVIDFGCHSMDNCDFPDFAHPMATAVEKGECDLGLAFCFTGNGMSMATNTHPHVRATICWEPRMAENARRFFNANVLCLPAGYVAPDKALDIIHEFVTTAYDGGERYERRIHHLANPNVYKIENGEWILKEAKC
ncbi:MAG: RpiB/LacA/LacB family sugar-phosphate isomerase [Paludibacteraceae bacterium]|nr:RpiB/LacA/LacB family sugar-phosphate isomerase [Paludibacteraceae bacterium]MBQ4018166.1 RpiB/LacA/LacB family sugar-phosphate isomerase [Paludibacteraceae bacterium]